MKIDPIVPVVPAGPIHSEPGGWKQAKEPPCKVRRVCQEDIEMNQWKSKERNQRVRDILNAMDKSIDRAREKREEVRPGLAATGALKNISTNRRKEEGEPRLPSSMFDRKGPMLKARPKSNNSG
jgi:hypothetical protein